MQYALLAYGSQRSGGIDPAIAAILERPPVTGWLRLHADESATTVASDQHRVLITDGPFIDSKEYLAGVILVEADNLDGALAVAREFQEVRSGGAIEVRPILGGTFGGA
jgi:hypothetical protein